MSEVFIGWITVFNFALTLLWSLVIVGLVISFVRKNKAVEEGGEGAEPVERVIARVLSRRLESMLDPEMPPEALYEMADQVEVFTNAIPTPEEILDAWALATETATVRLGNLAEYADGSLLNHAARVSQNMAGLAKAAWRNENSPQSLLAGQAYECVALLIEEVVIGGWPSDVNEVHRMVANDAQRAAEPSGSTSGETLPEGSRAP